jgi:hypothetical protein
MQVIKIENRSWRCALAHISSNYRRQDSWKGSFNILCIARQTADNAL